MIKIKKFYSREMPIKLSYQLQNSLQNILSYTLISKQNKN